MASELVLSALDAASLIDWATTCVVAGVGLLLDKGLPPFEHQIGPQLSDPRIAYPHTPGAETHCPKPLLVALAFLLPLALLACTQLVRPSRHDFNHALLGMVSSLSFSLMLVAIIKAAAGRLRPDFLARCKPVDGVCTGAPHDVIEGRKSFPSGHTALAFASLGFVGVYWTAKLLHAPRLRHAGSLWKVALAAAPWVVALLIGLSRIADYWHHWEDVATGALIGSAIAYGMYRLRFPPVAEGADPLPAAPRGAAVHAKGRSAGAMREYPV
jgi:diacylglycerol diphosphate phosphatase/phosphatidate phosphatase|eukprot:Transcript_18385.p2 GENE.Transcript_18385~~Transcript_18385.p2  ORF type:complete len:270 (-),score=86.94 Transcript_18385:252-1061(-)